MCYAVVLFNVYTFVLISVHKKHGLIGATGFLLHFLLFTNYFDLHVCVQRIEIFAVWVCLLKGWGVGGGAWLIYVKIMLPL